MSGGTAHKLLDVPAGLMAAQPIANPLTSNQLDPFTHDDPFRNL